MRSAVQYFSSSVRLGPFEGVGGVVGSAGSVLVDGADGEGEAVGSTAPATVDDAEGAGDLVGPWAFAVEAVCVAEAGGSGVPVAADAGAVPSTPVHRPSARAGIHLYLERNEGSFHLGGGRTTGDTELP
ncbi:hypothetical protein ACIPSA_41670 [Streptomyces sp. NPDC086549]|uniref:hypothetical protein n=1 Tax=Streptomyces sp. NPDC086549 TaxID=3365752 RepID=UPI0037FDE894